MADAERAACSRARTTSCRRAWRSAPYDARRARSTGGETLELAGIAFETLAFPGHSPGHLAYYADGRLFSGDVLFAGSVGRTDLPGARLGHAARVDPHARRSASRRRPSSTPGHGPATTLGAELARNPFLAELARATP